MKFQKLAAIWFFLGFWLAPSHAFEIIAHRGASDSGLENTLPAFAQAHAQNADWLEADIIATKDGALILSHDLFLESTSDVARQFPTRKRGDGHFYALDFSLSEILKLQSQPRPGARISRRPNAKIGFCTLEQLITRTAELNRKTKRKTGLYLELKAPAWHRKNGVELGTKILQILQKANFSRVILESFDPDELRRLKRQNVPFALTQLIGQDNEIFDPDGQKWDFSAMQTPAELRKIAKYAQNIGPHLSWVLKSSRPLPVSDFVKNAHAAGLKVHPYVFRPDIFPFNLAPKKWLQILGKARIDALFCDQIP